MDDHNFLKRYTQLFRAIDYLETEQLQLHSPGRWEDTNDSLALELYAKKMQFTGIYALCLTGAKETFHHWKVFCPESRGGGGGVCIEFDKEQLKKTAEQAGLTHGKVNYIRIKDLPAKSAEPGSTLFLKRLPYSDEKEYRLIGTSMSSPKEKTLSFEVPRKVINKVILSPWMNSETADKCRTYIREIEGCENLAVVQPNLLDNQTWRKTLAQVT